MAPWLCILLLILRLCPAALGSEVVRVAWARLPASGGAGSRLHATRGRLQQELGGPQASRGRLQLRCCGRTEPPPALSTTKANKAAIAAVFEEKPAAEILVFLESSLQHKKWHRPQHLRRPIWQFLAAHVKPHRLKELLQGHPRQV